jgi:hypothetical protein
MPMDRHGWMGQLDVFALRELFVPLDGRLFCFGFTLQPFSGFAN